MGSKLARYEFTPGENEQIDVVIKAPEEIRSMIHGVVKDFHDRLVEDAVVKLFEADYSCNPCSLKPICHTFTDDCGQFIFGPLIPGKHYVIKVWVTDVKTRHLDIESEEDAKPSRFEYEDLEGEEIKEPESTDEPEPQNPEIKSETVRPKPQGVQPRRPRTIPRNQRQP